MLLFNQTKKAMRYIITSGNVKLGEVRAESDADFQNQLKAGVNFYLPLLFNVWTNNPFTTYASIKEMPKPPQLTFSV